MTRPLPPLKDDPQTHAPIVFRCNICDGGNETKLGLLTREEPTCIHCGSTVRMRSIVHILTTELFDRSLSISEIKRSRPDIVGIGMSCWDGYALPLAQRLAYTNTYYHQEPRLDITNIPSSMEGTLDFVISSDVFEHVAPPVSVAFENTRKLLKPDGVFIFSVPFTHPGEQQVPTTEHFPDLHTYEIVQDNGVDRLRNTTRDGQIQYFDNLVFHGGPGSTLEMRIFSEWSLLNELSLAGFEDVQIYSGPDLQHGIYWANKWSVPVAARIRRRATVKSNVSQSIGPAAILRGWLTSFLKGVQRRR